MSLRMSAETVVVSRTYVQSGERRQLHDEHEPPSASRRRPGVLFTARKCVEWAEDA